jgi:queuine tRNA-ribosyltransferase
MGVGRPLDLVEGVAMGVDMFDCVIPTRHARSGMFYTSRGRIRITDARYRRDMYPPDSSCSCYTCTNFSRAYIHHLFKIGEVLGATLTTLHNIHWFTDFMGRMRASILDGTFEDFRADVHKNYPERPVQGKKPKRKKKKS